MRALERFCNVIDLAKAWGERAGCKNVGKRAAHASQAGESRTAVMNRLVALQAAAVGACGVLWVICEHYCVPAKT